MLRKSSFGLLVVLVACGGGDEEPAGGAGVGAGIGGGLTGGTGGGLTGGTGGGGTTGGTGAAGSTSTAGGGGVAGGAGGGGAGSGSVMCSGESKDGACKATAEGVYAMKVVLDVWWGDQMTALGGVVDPGRGQIEVYLKGEIQDVCDDGKGGKGVVRACGTRLPAFTSDVTCDAYQIEFPDSVWDSPMIPTFTTSGETTGFNPGDTLTLALATGLVGIDMDDPEGTWPTAMETGTFACPAGTGEKCFPDHDGDGKPGITVKMKTGSQHMAKGCGGFNSAFTYRGSPTSLDPFAAGGSGGGARAEEVYIGLRTSLGGAGEIAADCMSGVGDATATRLDSRAFGCKVMGGTDCTVAQATFVDENVPTYNILKKGEMPPATVKLPMTQINNGLKLDTSASPGPRSSVVRLGDLGQDFSCADIRNAAFPAL